MQLESLEVMDNLARNEVHSQVFNGRLDETVSYWCVNDSMGNSSQHHRAPHTHTETGQGETNKHKNRGKHTLD